MLTLWLPYQLLVSCDSAIMAPVISCLQLPVILYHNSVQNENVVTHHCIIVSEGVTSLSFAAAAIPLGCSFLLTVICWAFSFENSVVIAIIFYTVAAVSAGFFSIEDSKVHCCSHPLGCSFINCLSAGPSPSRTVSL